MKLGKTTLYLLLFILPTQLSINFWPSWSYVYGIRVDYLSPSIQLVDILLVIAAMANFSVVKSFILDHKWSLGSLMLFASLNSFQAIVPQVAILWWYKFALALLVFILYSRISLDRSKASFSLSVALVLISIIGIGQFLTGHNIGGIFYFLGERSLSVLSPGIAKQFIFNKPYLRAYSTFPHPNALAGFLLVGNAVNLYFSKSKLSTLTLAVSLFALLLTFSQNAYFAGSVSLAIFALPIARLEKYGWFMVPILTTGSLVSLLLVENLTSFNLSTSIATRVELLSLATPLFTLSPTAGIGLGNFVPSLPLASQGVSVVSSFRTVWSLQPVHNIYILLLSELGLVVLAVGVYFVSMIVLKASSISKLLLFALFVVLLTGFFDHYWLTISQDRHLLAMLLGIVISKKTDTIAKDDEVENFL